MLSVARTEELMRLGCVRRPCRLQCAPGAPASAPPGSAGLPGLTRPSQKRLNRASRLPFMVPTALMTRGSYQDNLQGLLSLTPVTQLLPAPAGSIHLEPPRLLTSAGCLCAYSVALQETEGGEQRTNRLSQRPCAFSASTAASRSSL